MQVAPTANAALAALRFSNALRAAAALLAFQLSLAELRTIQLFTTVVANRVLFVLLCFSNALRAAATVLAL